MSESTVIGEPLDVTFLRKRDYKLIRELGEGACGKTVLIHDEVIDEYFVCKKYSPRLEVRREELFENFKREIKLMHKVLHANVVRSFNYYLYPDSYAGFILMEYVEGESVTNYCQKRPERVNDIFVQAVNGFSYLFESKILHRDIRPHNLMVTSEGCVKIIDLGFGKLVESSGDFGNSVSLNWWCEQPDDFREKRYDFSTEVYFVGKLFEKIVIEIGESSFSFEDVLRRMCEKDPSRRFVNFSEVLTAVGAEKISEIQFSNSDLNCYRYFSSSLYDCFVNIETGAVYVRDVDKVLRQLEDVYYNVMLEREVPDTSVLTRCFVDGVYRYRKGGFPVDLLASFLRLFRKSSPSERKVVLANLYTKLDAVPRYRDDRYDDVPF